jgi:hypothetical protein
MGKCCRTRAYILKEKHQKISHAGGLKLTLNSDYSAMSNGIAAQPPNPVRKMRPVGLPEGLVQPSSPLMPEESIVPCVYVVLLTETASVLHLRQLTVLFTVFELITCPPHCAVSTKSLLPDQFITS